MPTPRSRKQQCEHLHHINATRITALEKELSLHVEYQREMVNKSTLELQKRLDGMNEFREALKDAQLQFMTKNEYNIQHRPLTKSIDTIEKKIANWEGRIYMTVGIIASISVAVGALIMFAIEQLTK